MKQIYIGMTGLLLLALLWAVVAQPKGEAFASVNVTGEYSATSTSPTYGIPSPKLLKTCVSNAPCPTTLGSVIVTGAGTAGGNIDFWDATTTDVNLRTGNLSSTTIFRASLPKNATVGTYTFDILFTQGLLVTVDGSGTVATTTITYR